eukprot:m.20357 g.20357  ORF g.20357 m.20357 type:complete len:360 (-) comp12127_c0_seq1:3673-4752(-)
MSSSSEQPHNGSDAIYDKAHSSERRSHVPATGMTGVEGTGSVDEDENDMDDTLVDWIVAPWGPHHSQPHHAQSNKIRTAKYTWYNFLPKNLWIQFHRVANVYFLFMACLNFIPAIGSFAPIIGFMPLVFVLSVTAVKDAVEDGRRKTQDKEINNGAARVVVEDGDHRHRRHSTAGLLEQPEGSADLRRVGKSGRVCDVAWQDVAVGDIVVLKNGDMMPADVLLLHSSDPSGLAYSGLNVVLESCVGYLVLKVMCVYQKPHHCLSESVSFAGHSHTLPNTTPYTTPHSQHETCPSRKHVSLLVVEWRRSHLAGLARSRRISKMVFFVLCRQRLVMEYAVQSTRLYFVISIVRLPNAVALQ